MLWAFLISCSHLSITPVISPRRQASSLSSHLATGPRLSTAQSCNFTPSLHFALPGSLITAPSVSEGHRSHFRSDFSRHPGSSPVEPGPQTLIYRHSGFSHVHEDVLRELAFCFHLLLFAERHVLGVGQALNGRTKCIPNCASPLPSFRPSVTELNRPRDLFPRCFFFFKSKHQHKFTFPTQCSNGRMKL